MIETDGRDGGDVFGDPAPAAAPLAEWCDALRAPQGSFARRLAACYGDDGELIARRLRLWRCTLERFRLSFGGEGDVYLLGVPSRVNWEGHHVDHQGGYYNATTEERETVAVVRAAPGARIRIENLAERFAPRAFEAESETPAAGKSDWASHVKGALYALRARRPGRALTGMDLVIGSDVPIGVGLSSSHALVLAALLAALAVNRLQLSRREAVAAVQDGEWFVGSRTGLGDQAAMIFGRRGRLFSSPVVDPREIAPRYVELPASHARVLIDTFTQHKLQGADRVAYNARVFAYKAAFPLVLDALRAQGLDPDAVRHTRRLADIAPDRFPLARIYRALADLPDRMTLSEAEQRFGAAAERLLAAGAPPPPLGFRELLQTYFADGVLPDSLSVKGVALYGLAECWRSRLYADLIERGDLERAGRLVYRGHDGDRVARTAADGRLAAHEQKVTSPQLEALARDAESGDAQRAAAAALEWQPGEYRASVPALDRIVDLCRAQGALSATLTGAGLGGMVIAMVARECLVSLRERLLRFYEQEEAAELAAMAAAHARGQVQAECLEAARALARAKLEAGDSAGAFRPQPAWLEALAPARALSNSSGEPLLRLLPADYRRDGVSTNHSVAGAGYLCPPRGGERVG